MHGSVSGTHLELIAVDAQLLQAGELPDAGRQIFERVAAEIQPLERGHIAERQWQQREAVGVEVQVLARQQRTEACLRHSSACKA